MRLFLPRTALETNMGLFNRLLDLHQIPVPLEDFFTELIAYFLQQHPEALRAWLKYLHVPIVFPPKDVSVSTQTKLADNDRLVCPDILISLCSDNAHSIILVESKIAARESPGQLRQYAELLAGHQGLSGRALLYITRDDDPKNTTHILKGLRESGIGFYQGRWHEFYKILGSFPDSWLAREIRAFMEEHGLSHQLQMTLVDTVVTSETPLAIGLMRLALSPTVTLRFEQIVGEGAKLDTDVTRARIRIPCALTFTPARGRASFALGFMHRLNPDPEVGELCAGISVSGGTPPDARILLRMAEIMRTSCDSAAEFSGPPGEQHRLEMEWQTVCALCSIVQHPGWTMYRLATVPVGVPWVEGQWTPLEAQIKPHDMCDAYMAIRQLKVKDFITRQATLKDLENYFLELLDDLRDLKNAFPFLFEDYVPSDFETFLQRSLRRSDEDIPEPYQSRLLPL